MERKIRKEKGKKENGFRTEREREREKRQKFPSH